MNQPTYQVEYLPDEDQYIFESIGKNGSIYKVIIFTEVQRGVFNFVAFVGVFSIAVRLRSKISEIVEKRHCLVSSTSIFYLQFGLQ